MCESCSCKCQAPVNADANSSCAFSARSLLMVILGTAASVLFFVVAYVLPSIFTAGIIIAIICVLVSIIIVLIDLVKITIQSNILLSR